MENGFLGRDSKEKYLFFLADTDPIFMECIDLAMEG